MISSTISRMIWPYDISNLVYHSHMISWILWYCILYYDIIAPAARRDGAGWGRQTPGAPPAPATPSPTCWGRMCSCKYGLGVMDLEFKMDSSMDLEFKMDSSWKLAEWRRTRTLRLVSTCTATSTWKRELRVRADCGASEPQALAAEAASANI